MYYINLYLPFYITALLHICNVNVSGSLSVLLCGWCAAARPLISDRCSPLSPAEEHQLVLHTASVNISQSEYRVTLSPSWYMTLWATMTSLSLIANSAMIDSIIARTITHIRLHLGTQIKLNCKILKILTGKVFSGVRFNWLYEELKSVSELSRSSIACRIRQRVD